MNLKRRLWIPLAGMTSIVSLCTTACVNEAYDLSKGIDTSIDINADISVPFVSTQKILIGDLLEIDSGNSMITVADNGDYVFSIQGDPITRTVEMPDLDLGTIDIGNEQNEGGFRVNMEVPVDQLKSDLAGSLTVPEDYKFDDIRVEGETSTAIKISQEVDYVSAIDRIDMDADLMLSLELSRSGGSGSGGSITISKGFVLDFPDYIVVGTPSDSRFKLDPDGNSIKTVSEVTLEMNKPLTVSLDITAIDFTEMHDDGQGFATGYIVIDDEIVMSGLSVSAMARSFGSTVSELPTQLTLDIDLSAAVNKIKSARLILDPEVTVEDQTIEVAGERPEFLEGANVNADLYNPVITLTVNNSSPVSAVLSATITANTEGKEPVSVRLGSQNPDDGDAIVLSPGVTPIYISRKPYDPGETIPGTNEYIQVVKDEIGTLISALPDNIVISDIEVKAVQKMTDIDLTGTDEYRFSLDYSVYAPMAFGEDLLIEYPYDIKELNDVFNSSDKTGSGDDGVEIRFTEATVSLTLVNGIPLGFGVTVSPIDVDGNVIASGIDISMTDPATGADISVAPGSETAPSSTRALITIHADMDTVRKLDGFRLNFTGSCNSEYAGQAINKEQGIQLKDISVSIVGGISTEF